MQEGPQAAPIVLVADDETGILGIIKDALEMSGFATILATDGSQAVEVLETKAHEIRAVVTDIKMGPGPDGWVVARVARRLNPGMGVVYISGDSAMNWSTEAVPNSVMTPKPFSLSQIINEVTKLINVRQA